jgi:predicted RNase H-like HicB family nuclease
MKFRVIIGQDEDGVFIAQCSALPGCVSQGQTRKEAEANIKEAIQGYIESLRKHDEPIPPSITEEIIDIAI